MFSHTLLQNLKQLFAMATFMIIFKYIIIIKLFNYLNIKGNLRFPTIISDWKEWHLKGCQFVLDERNRGERCLLIIILKVEVEREEATLLKIFLIW